MRRAALALLGLMALGSALPAQGNPPQTLEQSKKRLDEIRLERDRLEREQLTLQGRVSDVGASLRNLEKQRDATSRLVNQIEIQINGLGSQLDHSTAELTLSQDNLAEKRAVLQRRLVDIYKRGPLYTFSVLLTAESFGDLLARYKYLYMTSRADRNLVDDVARLTANVQRDRNRILGVKSELDQARAAHETEIQKFARLAEQRQSELRELNRTSAQTKQKLTDLEKAEANLNTILANLTKAQKTAAANRASRPNIAPTTAEGGALTTESIGKLEWPVDGEILYQFGPQPLKNGGVITRNGIAIAAPVGTPVKAVEAGTIALVQPLSTFGLSVIVEHENGYHTLYMQLKTAAVKVGQRIARGSLIGTTGGENSGEGPHLYFEIRGTNADLPLDPITWLKRRSN